jgi:hypothetical protein
MTVIYQGWQMTTKILQDEVTKAIEHHQKKFGFPPQILEMSVDQTDELPADLNLVVSRVRIPKNILLLGVEVSDETVCLDVEAES